MSFLPETDRYAFMQAACPDSRDCDARGRLRLSSALRFVENISTGHLEALDLGYQRLRREGIVFVLAAQAVKVYTLPMLRQPLAVKTCPAAYRGAQLLRESVLLSEAGETLVEVQASWVMIDPARRKPLRAGAFGYPLPLLADWQPFINPAKMRLTPAETPVMARPVRASDLDLNAHMNNTVYADVVLDALPGREAVDREPDALLLRLRHETKLGETLTVHRDACPGGYRVSALAGETLCFEAMMTFKN